MVEHELETEESTHHESKKNPGSGRILTQEALNALLAFLHTDRELAGARYQDLRVKLILYFERHLGGDSEEPADETLNRIARRLSEGEAINDIDRYALGVARHLKQERLRRPEQTRAQPVENCATLADPRDIIRELEEEESNAHKLHCMRRCLESLSPTDRELIIEYYSGNSQSRDERRRQIAERLGLTLAALYLRIHRIRQKLEICFQNRFKLPPGA